ncbi:MAG: tetratricopeptide repeat protein [Armatimonadota bacterium]
MPECLECGASVPARASLCPDCGAKTSQERTDSGSALHSLLLNAYLLNLRGDSDAAISECIKALRIDPDSLETHSLLGDIYKAAGKAEEAAHWYQLALDLKPRNRADRERLSGLISELTDAGGRRPARNLKAAGTVAVLLIAAILGWSAIARHGSPEPPQRSAAAPTTPPVIAPLNEPPPGPLPERSDREADLISATNGSPELQRYKLQIVDAEIDPRDNSAVITFTGERPEGERAANTLVRCGLAVLREVFLRDTAMPRATVRALYPISAESGVHREVVFAATAEREKALGVDPDTATYQEQLAAMENPWVSQDLR